MSEGSAVGSLEWIFSLRRQDIHKIWRCLSPITYGHMISFYVYKQRHAFTHKHTHITETSSLNNNSMHSISSSLSDNDLFLCQLRITETISICKCENNDKKSVFEFFWTRVRVKVSWTKKSIMFFHTFCHKRKWYEVFLKIQPQVCQ